MVQVNRTVNDNQHIEAIQEKSVICNCSSEVGKLWEELSKNRLDMQSMQQKLQMLQTPVRQNEPGKYLECYFVSSNQPTGCETTKPQTATVISLWF